MLTEQDYQLLSDYLDQALSSGERAALETRLATDDELRDEYEGLRQTVALVQALPVLKAPRDFTLNASQARRSARRMWLSPTFVSALSAAAAMLLIGFGLLSLMTSSAPALSPEQQVAGESSGVVALQPTEVDLEKTDVDQVNIQAGDTLSAEPPAVVAVTNLPSPTSILDVASGGGASDATFFNEPSATLGDEAQLFSSSAPQDAQPPDDNSLANSTTTQETETGALNGLSETILPSEEFNAQDAAVAMAPPVPLTDVLAATEAPSSLAFQSSQVLPTEEPVGNSGAQRAEETPTPFLTATLSPNSTSTLLPPTATVTLQPSAKADATQPAPLNIGLILIVAGLVLLALAVGVYLRGRRN